MKKLLAMSVVSLSVAFGLLAVSFGSHRSARSPVAEAAVGSIAILEQQCLSANQLRMAFVWSGYNEGSQWMDLSLTNNNFVPGTFVGMGPLASNQTTVSWDGILPGLTHFLRINTLTGGGWSTSSTIAFTTRNDCQFVAQPAQVAPGVGASNIGLNQVCLQNGTPRMLLTWTSSNQGVQWLDDSATSATFETFTSVSQLPSGQAGAEWDGLVAGSVHNIRISTSTLSGWIASPSATFHVRSDCQAQPAAAPVPTAISVY